MTVSESIFEFGDIKVAYTKIYRGANWLVCLHGLQSNRQLFDKFFNDHRFSQFSLLTVDLIGFGQSSKPTNFSYEHAEQVKILEALLLFEKIKSGIVLGHSLGGMLAILLSQSKSFSMKALTSLEGNLLEQDCGKSRDFAMFSEDQFNQEYPKFLEILSRGQSVSERQRTEWLKSIPAYVIRKTSVATLELCRKRTLIEIFEKLQIPRLLIVGEKGSFKSRPTGKELTIETITDAGHFMLLEQEESTLQKIDSFLVKVHVG